MCQLGLTTSVWWVSAVTFGSVWHFLLPSVLLAVSFGSVMAAKKKAWNEKDSNPDVYRAYWGAGLAEPSSYSS